MRTPATRRSQFASWLAGLLLVAAVETAGAQDGKMRGVVNDSVGAPIAEADVAIVALRRLTRTDAQGRFAIDSLPGGTVELSVRRLGYKPQTLQLAVSNAVSYSYVVTLEAQPTMLGPMSAAERRLRIGTEEFYQRRARGIGTFFTRDDISARHASRPSDMLRTTPGVRFARTSNGGQGVRFTTTTGRRECMPLLWIDGQAAPGMELDDVPVGDIEGLELYQTVATTPGQFWRGNTTACGTILVWTRTPGVP